MVTVAITAQGQMTIPASVRRELDLSDGAAIRFFRENGRIYLEKKDRRTEDEKKKLLKTLCGSIDEDWSEPQEISPDFDRRLEEFI